MEKKQASDNESSESHEAKKAEEENVNTEKEPAAASSAPTAPESAQKELLYLRAEFENYKRRMLREQDQSIKFANEKLIRELLLVTDQLERALTHSPHKTREGDKELETFVTGVEMTFRQLVQFLGRFGVEFIGSPGEPFDPVRHEAISQLETTEDKANTVLEVLQTGCLFHGRLLQPARVVVGVASKSKGKEETTA